MICILRERRSKSFNPFDGGVVIIIDELFGDLNEQNENFLMSFYSSMRMFGISLYIRDGNNFLNGKSRCNFFLNSSIVLKDDGIYY